MKFLFVVPRFHTNLVPIVDGLIRQGNEVAFCVRYCGPTENHGNTKIYILSENRFTQVLKKRFDKKGPNYSEKKLFFWFSPTSKQIKTILNDFEPDVVILRNRNLTSKMFYRQCRFNKQIISLLYNQSPVFFEKKENGNIFRKIVHWVWELSFPKTRITPCRYKKFPVSTSVYKKDKNAHFLPFVIRSDLISTEKTKKDCVVRFFDSGKFRYYKNHFIVLKAAEILLEKGLCNFSITIQGQVNNVDEEKYFEKLKQYINEHNLDRHIFLLKQVDYTSMPLLFKQNDVFVLPSVVELANVSVLDAMTAGLAVICTDANGTADYIKDGEDGFIFKTNNADDLAKKMGMYLSNPKLRDDHGRSAFSNAINNYSFQRYYDELMNIISNKKKQ